MALTVSDGSGSDSTCSSDGHKNSRFKKDFEQLKPKPLGEGGFGKVYLCRNKLDGKEYAIKVIPFESETEEERVLWEVKTMAKMCHANIVMYHQAWLEEGVYESSVDNADIGSSCSSLPLYDKTLYIVLELCDGTLEQRMPLESYEAWKILYQVSEGLEHIHKKGVIHRDLSTKNIFLDKLNVPKIGDFGLARFSNNEKVDLTQYSGQGAVKYCAPETKGDNPFALTSSDVYSLGIIFFELFYPMESQSEAVRVISDLKSLKKLPNDWKLPQHEATLLSMIDDDPTSRPSLATIKNLWKSILAPAQTKRKSGSK